MSLRPIKVTYEDGNTTDTMCNGTNEEIERYYIGQVFNFGDTDEHPADLLVKAVSVDFLEV